MLGCFGQCPMPISWESLMNQNGKYASNSLNAAYVAAQEAYTNVSAAMCSDNNYGIFSVYGPIFVVTGKVVPHKSSENDGLTLSDSTVTASTQHWSVEAVCLPGAHQHVRGRQQRREQQRRAGSSC
ncbi:unnamed protein product [Phytophthora lilii]|uniref:Unnamed protein product n=1 Tax=Phytophthora lilii TaxID=2077276 RepID=A0A9W6UE65_9STRA|nr:unnamed protein product [Phytophthora lilii]